MIMQPNHTCARHSGPFQRGFTPAMLALLLAASLLLLGGCAKGPVARLLPNMGTMQVAQHYFGPPTASKALGNGTVRHEWLLDREVLDPAHWETQKVYIGHDSDGFPEYIEVEVFVRDRMVRQTCRIQAVADQSGNLLSTQSAGNSCEELLRVPTTY